MFKRLVDFFLSIIILTLISPILIIFTFMIWFDDKSNPFYVSKRIGKNGIEFNFFKLRSMIVNADLTGVDSTSSVDKRITPIGKIIRKFKIDELPQLLNVLMGEMTLVGPRPNVWNDVKIYTEEEKILLSVKPGITDFSSIIFSDEGEILSEYEDPDLKYNQLIRPWKSRLGLFYIKKRSFILDALLISITVIAIFNKKFAINSIVKILEFFKKLVMSLKISIFEITRGPTPGFEIVVLTSTDCPTKTSGLFGFVAAVLKLNGGVGNIRASGLIARPESPISKVGLRGSFVCKTTTPPSLLGYDVPTGLYRIFSN